jgi:phage head maturation protease
MKKKPDTLVFAAFSKVDKQSDGTLIVTGIASTETEDSDKEIVKADAVRSALPDYMQFGNIREMHQPIASGTAISASVDAAGVTHLEAHIVDPVSVLKVETGVLKGFSIGGRVTKRDAMNKRIITGLKIGEISLVDRPANPDAIFSIVKFDSSGRALEPDPVEDQLKKGMYDVGELARLIQSLNYIASAADDEARWEKDNSAMPARLKAAVAELCGCLRDMVDEESRELLGLPASDAITVEVIQLATKALHSAGLLGRDEDTVEKKGAKYSKATVGALATVHKMLTDSCSVMEKLGYADTANQEDEETMKNDTPAGGANAATDEVIAKAARVDTLETENADLKDRLAKAEKAAADATAEAAAANETAQKIADQVVAKGYVANVVQKKDDVIPPKKAEDEIAKSEQPKNMKAEIRSAWRQPLSPIRGETVKR